MHRWIDHTAEVELRIEAASAEEIFREALEAVSGLLGQADRDAAAVDRRLELTAPDRAALLAVWLEELAFLAETRGLVCERLAAIKLGERRLEATVEARTGQARHLVKGVTYHRLTFARSGDRWLAGAVLDV